MRRQRGFTLTELVVVCAVLSILAGVAFPTARYTRKRLKEMELRTALREMRSAIDEYKRAHQRPFPTWSEVLDIVKSLGYDKAGT